MSRPGLWFPTLWLYFAVLPRPLPIEDYRFWLGLVFVTFPLNFVVYGWNDTLDAATDALNPRKDSYLFGARPTDRQLLVAGGTETLVAAELWFLKGSLRLRRKDASLTRRSTSA